MTTSATPREGKSLPDEQAEVKDHREKDRRQEYSKGYMYISIVGWICRREKERRNPRQSE
jgi:hypothetical protein